MNILLIGSYFPTSGGAERALHDLCLGLSKNPTINFEILCPAVSGETPSDSFKAVRAWTALKNKKLVAKNPLLEYIQNYSFVFPAVISGGKIIKDKKINLIHVQFGLSYGIVGTLLKKIYGVPLIATLHGSGFNFNGWRKIFRPLTKWVLKNCDKVIAVSDAVRKEASKERSSNIVVIRNGVSLTKFKNRGDRNFILAVGRLAKMKGFSILLESASDKRLLKKTFLIVGEGPERKILEKKIKELKLNNVKLLGNLEHKRVKQLMSQCSVFVMPSLFGEGLPIALIEAMACEKPVIGTGIRGIPEAIIDKTNGFLISPGNSKELSERILELIENKELRKKMGKRSRELVVKKFNLDSAVKKIEENYTDLIKNPK